MNVLVVCVQFPFPPRSGVNMRVYQLTRQLAARHHVTLLSYAAPDDHDRVAALREQLPVEIVERRPTSHRHKRIAQMRSLASPLPFASRDVETHEMQRAITDVCRRDGIDVVQLEGSLLAALQVPDGTKVVLDEHNIEYEVFRRMCEGESSPARRAFNLREYSRFRQFEQNAWRRVDGCVVTSSREEPIVRGAAPGTPTAVVPNGVDIDHFTPSGSAVAPNSLVFNGILDYRPNLDAAHFLVDDIWPRVMARCPGARLTIVGRAQTADIRRLRRPGVTVTGEVADVRPYLRDACVVGVPVRMGGGTRLKVVEGLAMGKAIVSTRLGCEGIAVTDGDHLLIADSPEEFSARIVELFESPERRQALADAGRRLAADEYTWDLAGERLEQLYQRVVAGVGPAATPSLTRAA